MVETMSLYGTRAETFAELPFRAPERVRERHAQIMALWELGRSLKQIGLRVGLRNHSSVRHHIVGDCRCATGRKNAAKHEKGTRCEAQREAE